MTCFLKVGDRFFGASETFLTLVDGAMPDVASLLPTVGWVLPIGNAPAYVGSGRLFHLVVRQRLPPFAAKGDERADGQQ